MDDAILEKKIRETLEKKAQTVHVDGLTDQRIRTAVYEKIEEGTVMKHRNWKKVAVIAAAICVLGSITAVALGKPSYISSHSSNDEAVNSFEEAKAMQSGYDAAVKVIENFSNGYQFKEAVPKYESTHDAEHNVLQTETTMSFWYEKDGMENVLFSGGRLSGLVEAPDETLVLEDGTELRYKKSVNKFVPPDYQATEEELKLQEEGKLNIGYGSSEIQVKTSQSVIWVQDGVTYSLFTFEEGLSSEEFLQMAKEVAES